MTNPTSNFGWQMPTSTDLVTDLPADFAVFGQAVDTSMADLKGGTTGQVLSKASNTDMDFTWTAGGDITGVTAGTGISGGGTSGDVTITNSMATAITTAGDLIKGTGSGTFDRLGIGSTGQVLTVAAGAPSWATPSGGSWTQAATGSLTGASVAITGLTGQKFYVACIGWSHTATSEEIQIRFNNNSTAVYRRTDSDSAVSELYPAGNSGTAGTSTRSLGFFVDMANTSLAGKPMIPVTPRGNVSGGWFMDTTAITQINILTTGGTFDAGTYYVWSFS